MAYITWVTKADGVDTVAAADVNTLNNNIEYIRDNPTGLVGELKYYDQDHSALSGESLPEGFVIANGQLISDADSLFNNKRVRNLNGADVVLTLTWTADAGGAYASVSAVEIEALNDRDDATGSGIAANTIITDIDYDTNIITISDISASGSIETTFNNPGIFLSGGQDSTVSERDEMQGHKHLDPYAGLDSITPVSAECTFGTISITREGFGDAGRTQSVTTTNPITDGTNGTPRIGSRTKPQHRKAVVLIRIK
jgi:hypothetical protein